MWILLRLIWFLNSLGLGSGRNCKVLLLVAHADDEVLFAGEALIGRKVRLNCDAHWHVVLATHASTQRVQEFWAVLDLFRSKTLAANISGEAWDYEDCNYESCELFPGNPPFQQRLIEVFQRDNWDYVVTHNNQGEYHHKQHSGLYTQVAVLFSSRPDVVGEADLWVFNPLPELNTSMSPWKTALLQEYLDRTPTTARLSTFSILGKYTEHLVPAGEFSRPPLLGVPFWHGLSHGHSHFEYTFRILQQPHQLKVTEMETLLKEFFAKTWTSACGKQGFVRYPETCRLLWEQSENLSPQLYSTLKTFEVQSHLPLIPNTEQAHLPKRPSGPANFRCLIPKPLNISGKITHWRVKAEAESGVYVELLALRPIWVGWKQGRQNSYKILSSSGPIWVSETSTEVLHEQTVHVQPNDVVGWGVFLEGGSMELASHSSQEVLCIGSRGCDKADFCNFDSKPSKELQQKFQVRSVLPRIETSIAKPAGRQRYFKVMEGLDISSFVNVNSTYEELLTLRHRSDHPDLGIFEDKIRLRKELLPAAGVLGTPSIHLSNDDFDIARFLHGRKSYVVKPSHMSESQNVFVVQDGQNLLRMAWGHPPQVYIDEIQESVYRFSKMTALEWECRALVSSKPGVIVEELVLATKAHSPGKLLVDEYKFYTTWGMTVFAENIPFSSGAVMEISRAGHILTSKAECPPFCVPSCFPQMVQIAEKVATFAHTDFLRVDILVSGDCDAMYVSEVELFPASDFSQVLKDAVAHRWRRGYGVS